MINCLKKVVIILHHLLYINNLMNEKEDVKLAQSGDFEAFSRLIESNKSKLYALALKMTGNQLDAEDIVSETLMKAIDNIEKFRGESAFGTWLYSIALNQSRALLAKQKQTELKQLEEYLPGKSANEMHQNDKIQLFDWDDPHSQLESAELKEIIQQAIDQLPYNFKEVFLLRYFEELSIKEIADMIQETVASTKSRVLRAKLVVREHLSKTFEERYGQKMS